MTNHLNSRTLLTRFRGLSALAALACLVKGNTVSLRAEPDNPYDAFAVACYAGTVHVGYVLRSHNARLIRAIAKGWVSDARVDIEAIIDGDRVVAAPHIVITWDESKEPIFGRVDVSD